MTPNSLVPASLQASAMAVAGLTLGLCYFALLRWTVRLYGAGRRSFAPVGLTLARLAGATIFFAFAARLSALSLLAAFVGFLAARMIALRGARRAA